MSILLFSVTFAVAAFLVLVAGAVVAAHLILWRDRRAVKRNAQRDARIATAAALSSPDVPVSTTVPLSVWSWRLGHERVRDYG